MSNKKKPVGMALDITTGKSYKVYKPEPVSEQMPPEFEWIKPGVVCLHKIWPGEKTIKVAPYFHAGWGWCTQIAERGMFQLCSDLMQIPNDFTITLTLTREQAEGIAEVLADVLHYGPSEELAELKKQIEEKLK